MEQYAEPPPGGISAQTSALFDDNFQLFQSIPGLSKEQEDELQAVMETLKQKASKRQKESRKRHADQIQNLQKQYQQKSEQLKVAQELMGNKDETVKFLREELNKTTVEVAQLRLTNEELESNNKQADAQIQFLNKELIKEKEVTKEAMNGKTADLTEIMSQLEATKEKLQRKEEDYDFAQQKFKEEREILENQLRQAEQALEGLRDENFELQNSSQLMESQHYTEKSDFIKAQRSLAEAQLRNAKLVETIDSLKEAIEKFKFDLNQAKVDCSLLETQNTKLEGDIKARDIKITRLNETIQERTQKTRELEEEKEKERRLFETSERDWAREKKANERAYQLLKEDNEATKAENTRSQAEIEKLYSTKASLEQKVESLKRELRKEKAGRQRAENAAFDMTQQLTSLTEQNTKGNEVQKTIEQRLDDALHTIEARDGEIKEKDEEIQSLMAQNQASSESNHHLQQQLYDQSLALQSAQKELEQIQGENKDLKDEVVALTNDNKRLSEEYDSMADELRNSQEMIESHQNRNLEMESKLKEIEAKLKSLSAEKTGFIENQTALREQLSKLNQKLLQTESNLEVAKREAAFQKSQLAQSQEKLIGVFNERAELLKKIKTFQDETKQAKDLKAITEKRAEDLKRQLDASHKEMDSFNNRLEELQIALKGKQKQLDESQEREQALQAQIKQLQEEKENNQRTNEELSFKVLSLDERERKSMKKHQKAMAQNKDLRAAIAIAQQQITTLEGERRNILQKNQVQESQLKNANDMIHSLTTENTQLSNTNDFQLSVIEDLQRQINGISEVSMIVDEKDNEIDKNIDTELNDLQQKLQYANGQNEILRSKFEEMRKNSEAVQEECLKAQTQFKKERTKNESLLKQIQIAEEANAVLQSQLDNQSKILQRVQNEMGKVSTSYNQSENDFAMRVEKMMDERQKIIADLREKYEQKMTKISNELGKVVEKEKFNRIEKEAAQQEVKRQKERVAALEQSVDELTQLSNSLRMQLAAQVKAFKESEQTIHQLQQKNDAPRETIVITKEPDNTQFEKAQNNWEKQLRKFEKQLSNAIKERDAAIKKQKETLENKRKLEMELRDIEDVVKEIHSYMKPSDVQKSAVKTTQELLEELRSLRDVALTSHENMKLAREERDKMLEEVSHLKGEIARRAQAEETKQRKIASQRDVINDLNGKIEALKQERLSLEDGISALNEAFERMKTNLADSEKEKRKLRGAILQLRGQFNDFKQNSLTD